MPRRSETRFEDKVLSIWGGEERAYKDLKPMPRETIMNELANYDVIERTANRYLTAFTKNGKLEKAPYDQRHVAYKPSEEFWNDLVDFKKQLRISKESLNQMGTYVMDALEKTIAESEEVTDLIEPKVWGEIISKPEDEQSDSFDEAMDSMLKEKPTQKELRIAYSLLDALISNCLRPTAEPTVFLRIESKSELPAIIEENIMNISKTFMALWDFLYKHPMTISEIREYLERNKPKSNYLRK